MEATVLGCCRVAAVFSDIHSNYPAFKACYDDARAHGADCFIFLGDYVSDLADTRETLSLLDEICSTYPTVCLKGNRERYMLEQRNGVAAFSKGSKTGSLLFTFRQLEKDDLEFFETLPIYDRIEINGIAFEIAHAARGDDRFYFEGTDEWEECFSRVFDEMETDYLLTGHSHKQYVRCDGGKTILNPGSIGVPRDPDALTQYALIRFDGAVPQFDLRQIPYDVSETIHRQFADGLVDMAPHWAISVLYDVITGKENTMELLGRVNEVSGGDPAVLRDEAVWHTVAEQLGMKFTEAEILEFYKSRKQTRQEKGPLG